MVGPSFLERWDETLGGSLGALGLSFKDLVYALQTNTVPSVTLSLSPPSFLEVSNPILCTWDEPSSIRFASTTTGLKPPNDRLEETLDHPPWRGEGGLERPTWEHRPPERASGPDEQHEHSDAEGRRRHRLVLQQLQEGVEQQQVAHVDG